MEKEKIKEKIGEFLVDSDKKGRFIVKHLPTGRIFCVEQREGDRPLQWGDINPATKSVEGGYGDKYQGATHKNEPSFIDNNPDMFKKTYDLPVGTDPLSFIEQLINSQ